MDGVTVVVILSITAVLVFILNVFCVSIIVRNQQLRSKPSSILTANLLSMHILQAVATMPFYALKRLPETNSNFVCSGFRFFYILTFYIACFCVSLISLDRFLAFRLKMKYRTTVTSKRSHVRPCVSMGLHHHYVLYTVRLPYGEVFIQPSPTVGRFMLLVNCFLPCLVIVGIYTYIMVCLRRFEKLKNKNITIWRNGFNLKIEQTNHSKHNDSRSNVRNRLVTVNHLLPHTIAIPRSLQ
uniref:G-protein coupled receptors family 1 profile domain-containing protein n=1 Tax=Clytia hemisphaerica TaxID=252671 RepID=A0A7M5XJ12_9CNID